MSYQIFSNEADADTVNLAINTLFGYPNGAEVYRHSIMHPSDGRVACEIGYKLIAACAAMTAEERLVYYDENNLVDDDYLISEGWKPKLIYN